MVIWFAFPEIVDNFSLQNSRLRFCEQGRFDEDMEGKMGPTHGLSGVHT